MSKLTSPLVKLLSASTDFVLWALRIKPSDEPAITQEEIEILIEQGLMRFAALSTSYILQTTRCGHC